MEWGLSNEDIQKITEHINNYLESFCDWKSGENLKKFLEEIESKLLSENTISIAK